MIIARGHTDKNEQVIMLGLTRVNIERLLKKEAMRLSKKSHGDGVPDGWEILIFFGETEETIAAELRAAGAIDDDTTVLAQPTPRNETQTPNTPT